MAKERESYVERKMGRKQDGDIRDQSYQNLGLFGSSAPLLSEATRTELTTL